MARDPFSKASWSMFVRNWIRSVAETDIDRRSRSRSSAERGRATPPLIALARSQGLDRSQVIDGILILRPTGDGFHREQILHRSDPNGNSAVAGRIRSGREILVRNRSVDHHVDDLERSIRVDERERAETLV